MRDKQVERLKSSFLRFGVRDGVFMGFRIRNRGASFGGVAKNRFHPYLSFIETGGRDVHSGANSLLMVECLYLGLNIRVLGI